jgi:hypothetical protein
MAQVSRWFLVVLLVFGVSSVGFGADSAPAKNSTSSSETKPKADKGKKTTASKPQKLKGEITVLDTKTGTLTVKGPTDSKSFVTQDAAKDSVERMTVGEQVRVVYSEKEGKLLATSVKRMKIKSSSTKESQKKPGTAAMQPPTDSAKSVTK